MCCIANSACKCGACLATTVLKCLAYVVNSVVVVVGLVVFIVGMVAMNVSKEHGGEWILVVAIGAFLIVLGILGLTVFSCCCSSIKCLIIIFLTFLCIVTTFQLVILFYSSDPEALQDWFCKASGEKCETQPIFKSPYFPICLIAIIIVEALDILICSCLLFQMKDD